MEKLEYYLNLEYPYEIKSLTLEEGGGFFITYPDLEGCMSDGDTIEETLKMGEDARKAWIEIAYESGKDISLPFSYLNKYNGRITVRTPKSLHRQLVEKADDEGISLNQYLVYLLSKGMNETLRK